MTDFKQNNKRIAQNTLLLYLRMMFLMAVNLYTSRIVLSTLGVEDFGINNVVGGVVTSLSFLTGSLSGATSRYITYNLGVGNMKMMKSTFGNILSIHYLLALVVFVFGETIGFWFVANKLQIPESRQTAAMVVYQFSVLQSILSVWSSPYNAAIIAHEKMKAFAYITILDALLKLLTVFLLVVMPIDKLMMYAAMCFTIQLLDRAIFGIYCKRHFEEVRVRPSFDKGQFKEMFTYSAWTMNGVLSVFGYTEGINILLNIFFGPAVNAARGVAVQVQGVVTQFCRNFQMALNPQITKTYAQQELDSMHKLIKRSSKFSFYLLLLLSLPVVLEAPKLLEWWLGEYPAHTVSFLRIIIMTSIIVSLSNPIIVAVHATGKLKRFQMVEGFMLLSIVPIAYLLLKSFNIRPEYVFCVHLVVELLTQYARVRIVLPMISMSVKNYLIEVALPIAKVSVCAIIPTLVVFVFTEQNIKGFVLACSWSAFCVVSSVYFLGCTPNEKAKIVSYVRKRLPSGNKGQKGL